MKRIIDWIGVIFGSFLVGMAFAVFFIPHEIAPGGVSGLATLLHALFGFKVGTVILIINAPLFFFGWKKYGVTFMIRTLAGTLLLTFFIDYFPWSQELVGELSQDILLSTVYGGVLMGAGVGLLLRSGATSGGTDLLAMLIHDRFANIRVSWVLFGIDFLVVAAAGIFLHPAMALYAFIGLFISARVMDFVQVGINATKAFYIISDQYETISESIIKELSRGVTALHGTGMYSSQEKRVLLCIVRRNQVARLRSIIKAIDENAFVIVHDAKEVLGEGFTYPSNDEEESQVSK